jgi:hypothetical protein
MIKEAYCSFEVSKLLKEKGFDVSCYGRYSVRSKEFHLDTTKPCNNGGIFQYSAPTHQMAMKWLREVHNICIVIEPHAYDCINEKNSSYVYSLWQGDNYYENPELKSYPSYEEVVEAAIKYCLENLI